MQVTESRLNSNLENVAFLANSSNLLQGFTFCYKFIKILVKRRNFSKDEVDRFNFKMAGIFNVPNNKETDSNRLEND